MKKQELVRVAVFVSALTLFNISLMIVAAL